ncbi:Ppx/GppA phosphatase family protein [Robiginitalea sp. IMCC43444]|uniref:Ppx/GppA phosphatase family protein n=1 Tax=Robiginitalea sp. IMCC43444 TaxID=3459121 RepID=UPI004041E7E2
MRIRKFAAIDIGSNAIRLLVQNVIEIPGEPARFFKNALVRVPVRLGADSFGPGRISSQNTVRIVKTIKAFSLLMEVSGVEQFQACATSALREASNGKEVLEQIYRESGISVDLIDGSLEAQIIASTDLKALIQQDETYLYVDVGGGSTEFTLFTQGSVNDSQSFKIGTVRLLNEQVSEDDWKGLEAWIRDKTGDLTNLSIIGSGGNINKLYKMSGRKPGQSLSYFWLNEQYKVLSSMSYEQRVRDLGLNPDRADVIIPATRIFVLAAKWSKAKRIHVPQIGLADGIIRKLYEKQVDQSGN